jgi:hypothetical protein
MKRARLRVLLFLIFLLAGFIALAAGAGGFLVVSAPHPSDVILVLAGETNRRPELALQLLAQGYGRRIVLDVPTNSTIYEFTQIQLAERYVHDLPQGSAIRVCPTYGLSTKDESRDVEKCLLQEQAKSVVIVTSDFHTRRALSIFRRELPEYRYTAAASSDDQQFGVRWWRHRQWAKTFLSEWLRLIWWKAVDQWR